MKAFFLKHKSIILSVFVNVFALSLVVIFCDMKYEVSDDFVMETILAGGYGEGYDPHLLYSNILIGYFLVVLYKLIPVVSWYFVFHIVVCCIALVSVGYLILERIPGKLGLLCLLLFTAFFSDDVYILVQFTKTAVAAAVAGSMLFLYAFWNKELILKKRIFIGVLGCIECLVGIMIRNVILMVLPFLFFLFVKEIWNHKDEGKKLWIKILIGISSCLCLLGGANLSKSFSINQWNKDAIYSDYRTNNSLRANVTDVESGSWKIMQEQYEENGYSLEDYYMVVSWNIMDQSIYDVEMLEKLASINRQYSNSVYHSMTKIFEVINSRNYYQMPIVLCVRILIILLILFRPKKMPWAVMDVLLTLGLIGYLIYSGRIVYRVEWGLFFCLATNLLWDIGGKGIDVEKIEHKSKALVVGMIIVLCCKIPLYIPDTSYKTLSDEEYRDYVYNVFNESWVYKKEKYRAVVSKRQPNKELIELMETDDEHYYLVDFSSGIQMLYYNYKPWIRTEKGYYVNNYSYLGGVTTYFPGCYHAWEINNIDAYNPYSTIANNNLLVVDNNYYASKLSYYKKYYNAEATMENVGNTSGYSIWKIEEGRVTNGYK